MAGTATLPHAAGVTQTRSAAVDLLMADDTLRVAYLLKIAGNPGAPPLDEPGAAQFLLWFAVDGRHQYQQVVLSPEYIAFLATPQPPFPTRLAAYVHARRGGDVRRPSDDELEAFLAWYYVVGAHELRLTPLLVARERRFLAESHPRLSPRAQPASRWDCFRLLVEHEAAPAAPPQGRRPARLAVAPPPHTAVASPWYAPAPQRDLSTLPGLNVIGVADSVSGIGEDARALADVLHSAGAQHSIFNVRYAADVVSRARYDRDAYFADRPLYPVNVFCLPAFETARLKLVYGESFFTGRYNIGYWPWELSNVPRVWRFAFDLVDEVWASSRFLVDVFQRLTAKPVRYMPPYVDVAGIAPFAREQIGLSRDDAIFLCMFDFNSYMARKNPLAAIDAFRLAFPSSQGRERLLIKTLHGEANAQALLELQRHIAADERITLVDGGLSREEICGLLQGVDGYVSLHRSEGFGRIIAEAMLLGTPVIATDWSGSASFVTKDTGFPVACTLRNVRPDEYIYAEGSVWAEPSIEDAARKMRLVRHERRLLEAIRTNAARAIRQTYGLGTAVSRLSDWLGQFAARQAGDR